MGGSVTLTDGNVGFGMQVSNEGSVIVEGSVTAIGGGSKGISVTNADISVGGDVVGEYIGVSAKASTIQITGDVASSAPAEAGPSYGIATKDDCEINIGGNVESNCTGVSIMEVSVEDPAQYNHSEIFIDGEITAPEYIIIWDTPLDFEDYSGITPSGYRIYDAYADIGDGGFPLGVVYVKEEGMVPVVPTAPQNFTAVPGDGQVALSWTAPASDGGDAISHYEVSRDNGSTWVTASTNTSHTFTGLTNGIEYTFKVRAVNSEGPGAEASATATPVVPEFAGGSGTMENPYLIETVDQLNNVRNYLGTENNDKHFKLSANLNLDVAPYNSGAGWAPIGTSAAPFTGTFDGDGHTISGLFVNRSASYYVGLFGYTGTDAEIRNLTLESLDISGCYYVGGLVGTNNGDIIDVNGSGNVVGEFDTGGLAGRNNGTITDSSFTGTVTGDDKIEYGDWTGGLVGYNQGVITNCWTDVTVVSEGDCIGGLVGENWSGEIRESFSSGTVTGYDYIGGLVGSNSEEITACYSTCTVNGDEDVGGLVGGNTGPISYSFAVGAVNGNSKIGGLVGSNTGGTDTGCYWDTETSGQNTSACGTGRSTANMKEQATFIGWDFDDVWGINGSDNNGYPFLRWQVYAAEPTAPTAPQNFIAEPGDGQVALSWTAPAGDGGSAVTKYQVSKDNGANWTDVGLNTSYTFTGLTNGTTYTFKVRAVNSVGPGAEASTAATPSAPAHTTHTVNFYIDSSLYASKTVTDGSALGADWSDNPTRSRYSFGGWFTGQNGLGTQYTSSTIINADIDLYAKWMYSGGGSDDDSDDGGRRTPATPTIPTTPSYKADVIAGNTTKTTLPVTVGKNVGNVSIEEDPWNTRTIGKNTGTTSLGEDPWHERPQGSTVITMPSIPGIDTYSASISVASLSTTDVQGTLTLNTDTGSITVPSDMLTGVAGINGNKAQITIGKGDKANLPKAVRSAIGDRPLVQLTLSIDGQQIDWRNPKAPVTVSIPYTPTAAELANPESIVIWYIDGNGNIVSIPNGRYDPVTGTVTFTATHFSCYAVSYNQVNFKDVANDAWYAKAVSFIAAREITSGTEEGNFSPEAKLTRGQFIVMLLKAYGIDPDLNTKDNFADAGSTYYTGYLAAAKRLGISAGTGNNMFAPEKEITRQEMSTLLYNALKVIDQLPGTQGGDRKTLDQFIDAGQVASWAKDAMELMVRTETVSGSNGALYPLSTTTRAEMAQVLYNLLSR